MRSNLPCLLFAGLLAAGAPAWGSVISQRVGDYQDSSGLERQRVAYDLTVDKPVSTSVNSSTEMILTHDQFLRDQMQSDAYDKQVYKSGARTNDAVAAVATQTWDRLTETRVLAAFATDHQVTSRTWGAGSSQWYADETVRLSFDVSRTLLAQPLYQVLDTDFQNVGNPVLGSSTGVTMGVRHLATPTTIVDYTASHIVTDNRPDTNAATVSVRQYLPPLAGAVHGDVTRALNRGYVTNESTYGQVDAWIADVAYLQTLWSGARARLGYRYYKEDETTRAWGDQHVFGSDTVALTLSQDVPKGAVDALGVPLTIDAIGARYLTNVGIAAATFEAGVTAKF